MFCPNCASLNDDSQHYCRTCGLKLEHIALDVATQRPSREFAQLLNRKKRVEKLGKLCLGIAGFIGFLILFGQLFYEKLKVLGPDLLFGGASIGLVIFMIAAAVLLSYPRMVMKFDNLKPRSPVDTLSDQEHHLDTNKLLGETPFEPASVTEHSTELLKERR